MASKFFSKRSPARSLSGCVARRQNMLLRAATPRDFAVRWPRSLRTDFSVAIMVLRVVQTERRFNRRACSAARRKSNPRNPVSPVTKRRRGRSGAAMGSATILDRLARESVVSSQLAGGRRRGHKGQRDDKTKGPEDSLRQSGSQERPGKSETLKSGKMTVVTAREFFSLFPAEGARPVRRQGPRETKGSVQARHL